MQEVAMKIVLVRAPKVVSPILRRVFKIRKEKPKK